MTEEDGWRGLNRGEPGERELVHRFSDRAEPGRGQAMLTGAAYGVLFVLGIVVGVFQGFYFSVTIGPVPVAAIAGAVGNVVLCRLAGRGMGTRLGAAVPAFGWALAAGLLAAQRPEGDLVVTGTLGGYVLLFAGAAGALIGVATTPTRHSRTRTPG